MRTSLVFTFICDDKPGLIEEISKTVANHEGNWLESRMCQMAGKFAGIIRVSAPETAIEQLNASLKSLESHGLNITIDQGASTSSPTPQKTLQLTIIGLDRPGILHEVSFALARQAINVTEMSTGLTSAPMTGEALFNANANIECPDQVDLEELQDQLEAIANELTIDISLDDAH